MKLNKAIFLIPVVFSGCASVPDRPQLLPMPAQRIVIDGYSVLPPNERGWIRAPSHPSKLMLVKRGSAPDETFAIEGQLIDVSPFNSFDEFTKQVTEINSTRLDPGRFKTIKNEIVPDQSRATECALSSILTDDTQAVKRTTSIKGAMRLEIKTLTCVFPSDKKVGFTVAYSHRYYPENANPHFTEIANNFLSAITFTSPR